LAQVWLAPWAAKLAAAAAMAITTKSDKGLRESNFFEHHRFDNHSAWLDRELRNKRRVRGEAQGHGFAEPRAPAPARTEKPFIVLECGMTSGKLLHRRYAQVTTDFKLDCERSDPYHFPNHLQVEDSNHYEDRRARSQHIDPICREKMKLPRDMALTNAVPQEMVDNMIMANYKDMKLKPDPDIMKIQNDPDIRLGRATVKDLNVDLSCVDLPAREKPLVPPPMYVAASGNQGNAWAWCLGGRKPIPPPDHGDPVMHKTTSLPGTLSGKSLLAHQKGSLPGPFHGSAFMPSEAGLNMTRTINARGNRNAPIDNLF